MPDADTWMEFVKPAALVTVAYVDRPSHRGIEGEVTGGREIISSVDEAFEGFVEPAFVRAGVLVVTFCFDEFFAKEIFSVHKVDRLPCAERGFQLSIIRLPRNYLCVGATEVRVNDNLAGIRNEHPPDVGQAEFVRQS